MSRWQVYLLACADNSLYCGVTTDFERRLVQHNAGCAAKYTRARRPVKAAALRENLTKSDAHRLEYTIKRLPAAEKIRALKETKIIRSAQ